jgi:hypothetical protein
VTRAAAAGASPGGGDAVEWLLARGANPVLVTFDLVLQAD